LIIRLASGLQVAVPAWMLDPLACSQLSDEATPRIAILALVRLGQLFDAQSLLMSSQEASRDASETVSSDPAKIGGEDASPKTTSDESTEVRVRKTGPVAHVSPAESCGLQGSRPAVAKKRPAQRKKGRRSS
jgi:hypothetical protein